MRRGGVERTGENRGPRWVRPVRAALRCASRHCIAGVVK